MNYIQVDIVGLTASPSGNGAYALVLGEVNGNRNLPIIIGQFEAQAIALELEKITPPRPTTHDLFRVALNVSGGDVTDIVIREAVPGETPESVTYLASVRVLVGTREEEIDARPGDAVAIAVRTDAPIFAADGVMRAYAVATPADGS